MNLSQQSALRWCVTHLALMVVGCSDSPGKISATSPTTRDDGSVQGLDAGDAGGRERDASSMNAADGAPGDSDGGVANDGLGLDGSAGPESGDAGAPMVLPAYDAGPSQQPTVARVIFDSDMSSDWDDVGDIAVLHGFASLGQAQIIAMANSSTNGATALCMDAINTYYGKPDIPIGRRPDVGGIGGYPAQIASEFPHGPETKPTDFPLAVDVYRRVLAAQPDRSVTIVTTGYLTNLKALMLSGPDQYSPLSGRALVQQKVKLLSCAGGGFPVGDEFNFRASADDSAYAVLNDWPAQVAYVGFDIGQPIQTAGLLREAPADSPIRRVYVDIENHIPYPSWGQVAAFYAVRAGEGLFGAVTVGHNTVEVSGHNVWVSTPDPTGELEQSYLLERVRSPVRESLNALMMLAPNTGAPTAPGDPSNLRATSSGSTFELAWTDNSYNETGFEIERGQNGSYATIGTVAADTLRFVDGAPPSTSNLSYRVRAYNAVGKSRTSTVWVYKPWTEINVGKPGDLPLYTYYQSSDLRWARGGDFRPDHVAVNEDSQHDKNVTIYVDVGALGSEGNFYVYFLYQDANNWYRLRADGSSSAFQRSIKGTIAQIGASGPGVNIGNGTDLHPWQIRATAAGALTFSEGSTQVLSVSEPLQLTTGKIGLGGVARTPVWENFHFTIP